MRRLGFFFAFILVSAVALPADTIKLKSGRVIHGQVASYGNGEFIVLVQREGHDHPERLILLAESVASIEFDAAGAHAATGPQEEVVVIDTSQEVAATGLQIRRGEKVEFHASGEVRLPNGRVTGPGGLDTTTTWPFPGERHGVLVAMVGSPQSPVYHVIGQEATFEARDDGELYLQINAENIQDARGAYTVRVRLPERATAASGQTSSGGSVFSQPSQSGRTLEKEFEVPADRDWIDTGLELRPGDILNIEASGTINYTSSKSCGPGGGERGWKDLLRVLPVNDVGRGALIGKMGEGGTVQAFFIGQEASFDVEREGRLFLGINDDNYENNSGQFRVKVEIRPRR